MKSEHKMCSRASQGERVLSMVSNKVHKSLRLERETVDRVAAIMLDGESEAAAYARVIDAGLDVLEGRRSHAGTAAGIHEGEDANGPQRGPQTATAGGEIVAILMDEVRLLKDQLSIKDRQIEDLTRHIDNTHTLQALALGDGKTSWWQRLRARAKGEQV